MLRFLRIEHLAVIDAVQVEFEPGLNVLTGETGAGKSMLVEAVGLLMGGRASADLIRTGETQAQVQAEFDVADRCSAARPSDDADRAARHQRAGAQPRVRQRHARHRRVAQRTDLAARRTARAARASDAARSAEPSADARRVRRACGGARAGRRRVPANGNGCSPSSTRFRWTSAKKPRGSIC